MNPQIGKDPAITNLYQLSFILGLIGFLLGSIITAQLKNPNLLLGTSSLLIGALIGSGLQYKYGSVKR